MTLEKAIEILKHTPISVVSGNDLEYGEARQLGIGALKLKINLPNLPYHIAQLPLPGETTE